MQQLLATADQLGTILTAARRAAGLTQAQAAARVGVSQSRLSTMESNPGTITVAQLFAFLAVYRLELQLSDEHPTFELRDSASEW
nr:helix-turn-helix transcriptional regulator [Trinickia terrae]